MSKKNKQVVERVRQKYIDKEERIYLDGYSIDEVIRDLQELRSKYKGQQIDLGTDEDGAYAQIMRDETDDEMEARCQAEEERIRQQQERQQRAAQMDQKIRDMEKQQRKDNEALQALRNERAKVFRDW